jgi:hypothetical protein
MNIDQVVKKPDVPSWMRAVYRPEEAGPPGGNSGKKHGRDYEKPNAIDETKWHQQSASLKAQRTN